MSTTHKWNNLKLFELPFDGSHKVGGKVSGSSPMVNVPCHHGKIEKKNVSNTQIGEFDNSFNRPTNR